MPDTSKPRRTITFEFDEYSLETLQDLRSRGFEFVSIDCKDPATGEVRTVLLRKSNWGISTLGARTLPDGRAEPEYCETDSKPEPALLPRPTVPGWYECRHVYGKCRGAHWFDGHQTLSRYKDN